MRDNPIDQQNVWAPHEQHAPPPDDVNVVAFPGTTDPASDARARFERLLRFCAEHGDPDDEIEFLSPDDYMAGFIGRGHPRQGGAS